MEVIQNCPQAMEVIQNWPQAIVAVALILGVAYVLGAFFKALGG